MKISILLMAAFTTALTVSAQTLKTLESKRIGLPNGWSLTPVGKSLAVGDLPLILICFRR